jgi:DNA-binding transcriptional ArsR family regulator
MGATKKDKFNDKQLRMAELAKAIGHPARIAILQFLLKQQSCICGDIVEELPLSQSTVSQHLKELKDVGIIQGEISGVKTCYCINGNTWKEMEELFGDFFKIYMEMKERCC